MSTAALGTPSPEIPELQTAEAASRSRRDLFAFRTIKADLIWRVLNAVVRIVSIPMAIRLLGNDRYGLWLTVSALLSWLNLSHGGLGGGLVNELARAQGRDDRASMQGYISTAYVCFVGLSLACFGLVLGVRNAPFLATFLGVQHMPNFVPEARNVFVIAGAIFSATVLANAIIPICQGMQESFLFFFYSSAGTIGSLCVLAILYRMGASLSMFTVGVGLPPLLATLALAVYFLRWRHPFLFPKPSLFERSKLGSILNYGAPLLVAQCCELLIYNSSNPLLASRLGVGAVPRYATALSLLMTVVNACDGIVRAYLGGYCEATARGDWNWIRKTARRTQVITIGLMGTFCIGVLFFGRWVIRLWAGQGVVPSRALLTCLVIYCFLMVCSHTNYVLLLGLGHVRLKAGLQIFLASAHVFGFFLLVPRLGLLALPIAGTFGYLVDIVATWVHSSRYIGRQLQYAACAPASNSEVHP